MLQVASCACNLHTRKSGVKKLVFTRKGFEAVDRQALSKPEISSDALDEGTRRKKM